jgi:hypothetical protein
MTRELRFTTQNLASDNSVNDCYLDPTDPIHAIRSQAVLGTLSPQSLNMAYDAHKQQQIAKQHFQLRDEAKRQGIRPGTPAWFALNQSRSR